MAAGRYRLDKQNRNIPASDFSVYATASLTGFYRVGATGVNIFRNYNQRIIYNAEFYSQPTSFWGGYDAAMTNSSMHYLASRTIVDARFLQRVTRHSFLVAVGRHSLSSHSWRRYLQGLFESGVIEKIGKD